MRRVIASLLILVMMFSIISVTASASSPEGRAVSTTTEYLENGDYVVTTVFESTIQFRTGKTGYKTSTYYNGSGTKIFDVTVTGTFNYSYGSKASATSASASVNIYNSGASFISKNAYTSSNSAVGLGQVRYGGAPINRSVILKCDVYGNLY